MSFWEKIKAGFRNFMMGRHGADELSLALLLTGLLCSIIASISGFAFLSAIGFAVYILCIFRMFSKNNEKRNAENRWFVSVWSKAKSAVSQFWVRMKNIRKFKYFKCPECKSLLRLPRKVGEVTVTCGKCHHAFKKKA